MRLRRTNADPNNPVGSANLKLEEVCRAVEQHAATIFEWRKLPEWNPAFDSLLSIALDHLTLGRAAFYAAILKPSDSSDFQSEISNWKSEMDSAVSGLRRAELADAQAALSRRR